jgi:F0F1-type ATP synthase membrane subunit b/b'
MKRLVLAGFLFIALGAGGNAQEKVEGAAHSAESGDPWIVWKWANFAILAAGLGYLVSKNLPPFFRSRTGAIQKGISEAQIVKLDAERRAADMDSRMNALGAEIERFRTQARAEMEQETARIRQEASKQVEKLQQQAEQEIEAAGKTARRELKRYAAALALDLAEQRIKTRLDAGTETGLVEGFVDDLKRQELQQQGSRN